MGMSNDYKIALECGSNLIRVGSRIFKLKKFYYLFLFPLNFLYAVEVKCNFEEVYQNSEGSTRIFF